MPFLQALIEFNLMASFAMVEFRYDTKFDLLDPKELAVVKNFIDSVWLRRPI